MKTVNTLGLGGLLKASGIVDRLAIESLSKTPFTQLANFTGQPAMSVKFRLICAIFLQGFPHGDDVFGGDVGLDIVNGVEDIAATGRQGFDIATNVIFNFLRGTRWQNSLGIYTTAPEYQVPTEITLEGGRFHVLGANVNRIEDVDPHFQEIRYQRTHVAV